MSRELAHLLVLSGVLYACTVAVAPCEAASVNVTLYRITPRNYTGLTNLDTGDAAGDAFFGIFEKLTPIYCGDGPSYSPMGATLCQNIPILQIPGFNVYTKTVIEADARFGQYLPCNPNPDTGVFGCQPYPSGFRPRECWFNSTENPQWVHDFGDLCSLDECDCEAVLRLAVGRMRVNFTHRPSARLPGKCSTFFPLPNVTFKAPALRTFNGTLDECCSGCSVEKQGGVGCDGFTHMAGICTLHLLRGTSPDLFAPLPGALSGVGGDTDDIIWAQNATGKLTQMLKGAWYSTQEAGQCQKGQVVGRDCWWRLIEQVRSVNASCVNGNMLRGVLERRPECFQKCPRPLDEQSICWIHCLFETIVGNKTATPPVPPMTREDLVGPFEQSFLSSDPAAGGCAEVPPCPAPCLPPCWAVPPGSPCSEEEPQGQLIAV